MYWNYRIVNCPSQNGGEDWLMIKEVYYDMEGTGDHTPHAYCDACLGSEDIGGVQELISRYATASALPVLHENDFKGDE